MPLADNQACSLNLRYLLGPLVAQPAYTLLHGNMNQGTKILIIGLISFPALKL